jgi:tetratricopeptide (TPR) repeat protein
MRPYFAGILFCAVGLFYPGTPLSGQTPPAAASLSPKTLAAEPYYIKSSSTVVSMNADGTGTRLQTYAIVIQSDATLHNLSVLTLLFASQSQHADFVYTRVVHPDGSVQETPVAGAIEQPAPVTREAPFYSDLETKQLPIKSMRIGDTLEWQARVTTYRPEAPNQFWGQETFSNGAVILDDAYELRVPAGLHLTVWTNPRAGAIASETDDAGQHVYRWHHSDLHPTVGPEAEAAKKAEVRRLRTPEEEVDAIEGKLPSVAWTTFPNWAAVGAWYSSLTSDRITPDDTIKAKVAELTAGKSNDLEKAQAVYEFVSNRIRYVGVAFGIGRYQPHTAAEIFANQYGDCKDKHTLLASMLSVLNLHANPVLVGAGIRFNSAVPSPGSFNHLITRLSLNGKYVWLDSTSQAGAWGALLNVIRDQDALVIPATPPAVVIHTPVDLPYPQISTEVLDGALDKDLTSDSKITFSFRNDDELVLRSLLHNVSPSDYGTFIQHMMGNMGFGGTTGDPEINYLDDPSQPLQLVFHYHRVKEKDWGENRITAIFQPIALPYFTDEQPPTSSIQLGAPRTESSIVNMQLPEGWSADLPDAIHAHTPFATCDVTYAVLDHMLHAERRLGVLQSKVALKDAKQYLTWYDDCGASGVPYIQLHPAPKVTVVTSLPEPTAPEPLSWSAIPASPAIKPSDPKAADLIRQARQSVTAYDLDHARKLLDQASAINPTEADLWTAYASIEQQLGVQTKVQEYMERELAYHPEEVQYYPWVAQVELSTGDPKAVATLRSWVKAAPGSLDAALALVRRLLELKAFRDTLAQARMAMDRLTPSGVDLTELKIVAAKAQVGLGQVSQAANSVAPLLKTVTDPVQINDIDSILAAGSAFLSDAETAQTKILADSEAATADFTTHGDLWSSLQQQSRIADQWDTMALILFHQGKFSAALGYATAALHANIKDAHDHLAAINAVVRNPAITAALRADEQKLRTFPLGPAHARQGVVFVTLLLANGAVIDTTAEKSASPGTPLSDPTQYLKTADLHSLFPPASKAHLIRTGFVNCHSGVCELVLSPFDGSQVTNSRPIRLTVTNLPGTQ